MKRALLLSSIVAISAVIGSGAHAWAPDDVVETAGVIVIRDAGTTNSVTAYTTDQTNSVIGTAISNAFSNVAAATFVRDADDSTSLNDEIANWAKPVIEGGNAEKFATVGQTFAVFNEKLNEVNTDITNALASKVNLDGANYSGSDLEAAVTTQIGNEISNSVSNGAIKTALDGKTTMADVEAKGYQDEAGVTTIISSSIASGSIKGALDAKVNLDGSNYGTSGLHDEVGTQIGEVISGLNLGTAANVNLGDAYSSDSTHTLADVIGYVSTNGDKVATVATTAGLVEDLLNDKESWVGRELGYDTKTTDAKTELHAAGFAADDLLGAIIENKTTKSGLADDNTFTGLNTFQNAGGVNVSKDGTTEYTANIKVDDVTVGSETGKALIVSGVDGIQAANFVANNGEFVTASGNFVAGDDKIEIKSGTDTMFKADNSGNIIAKGTVNINGATLTGSDSTLSSNKKVVSENGFEIDSDNSFLAGALKLNGNTVNTIDTGADAITSGNGTTIATTATVLTSAENATYTPGTSATNTSGAATLNGAIASLDSAIGNRSISSANSAINNALATNVAAAIKVAGDKIGNTSFSGANASGANNLTTAVNRIDNAIGNRGTLSTTNNHLTTTGTIVANLNALDSAIGNTSFSGANASGAANLTAAVNALDAEIGADAQYAQTYNGVAGTQTVKQNINAINETIGDITTLAAGKGSTGNALTNGTGTAAADVVTALNNIDATLGQIHGLKNGNSHLKANSNLANGTTVEQHLVSLDDAIGNRNISSANAAINTATASNMSAAMETTGNLIGSMDFDGTQYLAKVSNLTDAVRTLDNNIERVENRLEKVEYNLKSGLAAVSALSALVPNARDCGDTQLSVGTGVYADRVGVAVGGFHYFNDHVLFNAGASYGGTRDWAFRAGLTFGI